MVSMKAKEHFHINGDKYVGEWKDSKKNGQGTYITADATTYSGQWEDDKPGKDILIKDKSFNFANFAKPQWPSTVDFGCLNLCKDAVKGMTIAELNSFCMMRCSLK